MLADSFLELPRGMLKLFAVCGKPDLLWPSNPLLEGQAGSWEDAIRTHEKD